MSIGLPINPDLIISKNEPPTAHTLNYNIFLSLIHKMHHLVSQYHCNKICQICVA